VKSIEKFISPYIESQFPDFYKQEGPLFIAFVKAYYEWMESRNETLYHARNLTDYRDIDKTLDEFIIFFKTKYLSDIQFSIASNKKLFIKNSLDFYRSKGTPRSIDLFFKLIHGIEARVYYPGDDLFKTSDNEFSDIKYLEVEYSPELVNMIGFNIRGADSDAFAFAERLVKVKKNSRTITVIYISNLVGNFRTDEQIVTVGAEREITTKILGSATRFSVDFSTAGFVPGERIKVTTGAGKKAIAVVKSVENKFGVVEFELLNPGYGYSEDAVVLSSQVVLEATNVNMENDQYLFVNDFIPQFESVKQDLVELTINNATDISEYITFENELFVYNISNSLVFKGKVVSFGNVADNNCTVILNYDSSLYPNQSVITGTIYTTSNAESADISGLPVDRTATANVIAADEEFTIEYSQTSNLRLAENDVLEQYYFYQTDHGEEYRLFSANADVVSVAFDNAISKYTAVLRKNTGFFRTNLSMERVDDGVSFSIVNIEKVRFGVIDPVRRIWPTGNAYGVSTNTTMTISNYETFGFSAGIRVSGINEETVIPYLSSEQPIEEINLSTLIGTSSYGLDLDPTKGFDNIISEVISFSNVGVGSIESIIVTNPGRGYPSDPFFVIYEPKVKHYGSEEFDFKIIYNDGVGLNFVVGEIIEGQTTGTRARITENDLATGTLKATRLSPDTCFCGNELIISSETGISTIVTRSIVDRRGTQMGNNAFVRSSAFTGNGFITEVEVVNSGFGYRKDESIRGISEVDFNKRAIFTARVETQGKGEGYFLNRKSFLSSDKYIHDNDYYQEYSYEVLTALPFSNYKDTLIKVLHVAGNKPFGRYVGTSEVPIGIDITSSTTPFDLKNFTLFFNETVFYTPTTTQNIFTTAVYENDSEFFSHSIRLPIITQNITFVDSDTIYPPAVFLAPSEQVTLFENSQTFYVPIVA
jgi:hypothetical protein